MESGIVNKPDSDAAGDLSSSDESVAAPRLRRESDDDSHVEDGTDHDSFTGPVNEEPINVIHEDGVTVADAGDKPDSETVKQVKAARESDEPRPRVRSKQKKDPTFVPRSGAFFLHDARKESGSSSEELKESDAPHIDKKITGNRDKSAILPTKSQSKWTHDLYDDREQQPRTNEELIATYGVNIREVGLDAVADKDPLASQRPIPNRSRPNRNGGSGRKANQGKADLPPGEQQEAPESAQQPRRGGAKSGQGHFATFNQPPKSRRVGNSQAFPDEHQQRRPRGRFTVGRNIPENANQANFRRNQSAKTGVKELEAGMSQLSVTPGGDGPANVGRQENRGKPGQYIRSERGNRLPSAPHNRGGTRARRPPVRDGGEMRYSVNRQSIQNKLQAAEKAKSSGAKSKWQQKPADNAELSEEKLQQKLSKLVSAGEFVPSEQPQCDRANEQQAQQPAVAMGPAQQQQQQQPVVMMPQPTTMVQGGLPYYPYPPATTMFCPFPPFQQPVIYGQAGGNLPYYVPSQAPPPPYGNYYYQT